MNPIENARNNDLIRNVILDELVGIVAGEINDNEDTAVLRHLLCEGHSLLRILERLHITRPSARKVAGLALSRAMKKK